MIIYKITNKITGLSYVGQTTKSLSSRWISHQNKRSYCRFLKHAIQKYGAENFEIKVLVRCNSIEEMNHREQYYIKIFNTLAPNGYSLVTGGFNRSVSQETRRKMSASQKGISRPKNVSYRIKISQTLTGTKQSEKTKTKKAKATSRPIFVPELNITFNSIKQAIETLKAPGPMAIHRVLRNERPNWHGLSFQYANKE